MQQLNVPNPFLSYHITVESEESKEENIEFTGIQAVGMPAICAGHNEHFAMGITVGGCDTADIFVERFEDEKSDKYEVDREWKECKVREEIIKIKGEDDYVLRVRETTHGPVLEVTDFDKGLEKGPYSHFVNTDNEKECKQENERYFLRYSLCATYLKPRSEIIHSPLDKLASILNSKRIKEVIGHFKPISFPNMNFVLADTSGDVGWTANGLIPIRKEMKTYTSSLPQPGWQSKYDWKGYIPAEQLPSTVNPKCGYVVSWYVCVSLKFLLIPMIPSDTHLYVSNNNLTDPEVYPYFLGTRFAMGYRAKRASQLIDKELVNGTKITMDYMKSVQIDVHDLASEELVKNVLKNFDLEKAIKDHDIQIPEWVQFTMNSVIPKVVRDNVEVKVDYYNDPINREKAEYAWKILSEWDYEYTIESLGSAIYDSFLDILIRRLIIGGIYGAISKRNPSKVDPDTDDDEKKEEEEKILSDAERLKIAEKLSDNIMRNVYNRIFCGLTAFFYKRIGPVLTMFCSENAKKECWWIQNYGNRENLFIMSLIDAIDCIQFWSKSKDRSQWKLLRTDPMPRSLQW